VSVTRVNTNYAFVAERECTMKAGMRRGGSIGQSFLEGMLPTSPPTPPLRTASDESLPSGQACKDAAAAASPRSPRLRSSPRLQLSPHAAISAVAAAAVDAADRHPGSPPPPPPLQQQQAWDADASRDNDMRSGFGSVFSEAPLQRPSPQPRRSGDADGAAADAPPDAAPAAGHASAFGSVAVGWPQDAAAALAAVRHDHSARFPEDAGANTVGEAHSQVSGHPVSGHVTDTPCVLRPSAMNQGPTAQHPRLRCAAAQVSMLQCQAS